MSNEVLRSGTLFFIALILALSIHEAAHAFAALWMGDTTAKDRGRLTLNPVAHLDPLGTMLLLFLAFQNMGIGWAKPVPVDPTRFHHPAGAWA
jgi:Zn-dependent protease